MPCDKIVGKEKYSIISDYIGRPIQTYNQNGEKVWETDYDIYGKLYILQGEKQFIPFRQLGQYEGEEFTITKEQIQESYCYGQTPMQTF